MKTTRSARIEMENLGVNTFSIIGKTGVKLSSIKNQIRLMLFTLVFVNDYV